MWRSYFRPVVSTILYIIFPIVGLYALTLYPARAETALLRPIYPVSPAVGS